MAGSLKDQLLKAGLVTPDRARKVERQARVEKQARRKGKTASAEPSATAEARERAQQLKREKAERDRAQAKAANDKAAAKAQRAELKQIILQNDQRVKAMSDDDVAYNFVHGKRVKRIYVPAAQRDQISNGTLVIVNNDGHYHLLTRTAADKVAARDPKRIIVSHDATKPEADSDDEYYARFKVPDDLDW
ncbi:MAG: DUF2058 domain-containing protein [Gammaproteobacteria bacterium]|nr:DUF2058 domain-containing protein [Gammaproteobacteria bacterium]